MPGIDSAARTAIAHVQNSVANLAANATFTGSTVDGGAEPEAWATRIRPVVRHLTSVKTVHGYLVLEESSDGTTFIETRRVPIPADGEHRTFDWPLHFRYHRLKFINGTQAQTGMRLASTTFRGEGASLDEHEVLSFLLSATLLAASATFTSPTFDLGANATRNLVRVFAIATAGASVPTNGLRVEWSDDNTNWASVDGVASPAGGAAALESKSLARYMRVVFVNGATAQTALRLTATIISL